MADASWPIQKAIFDKLEAVFSDSPPPVAGVTVHDHVPPGTQCPYIAIGEDTAIDRGDKTNPGQETTITLHIWSEYRGRREVKQIMAAIYDALHERDLTVSGQNVVLLRFDFSETFLDPDGLTMHGVVRYRIVTQSV